MNISSESVGGFLRKLNSVPLRHPLCASCASGIVLVFCHPWEYWEKLAHKSFYEYSGSHDESLLRKADS
jgi:hypothetical protein